MSPTTTGANVLAMFLALLLALTMLAPAARAQGERGGKAPPDATGEAARSGKQEGTGKQDVPGKQKGDRKQKGAAKQGKLEIPADKEVVKHPGGFTYSVLEAGDPKKTPTTGDTAVIHFSEWLSDGTLIQTTRKTGPVRIAVGHPKTPTALSFAAEKAGVGGHIKVTMPPHLAYGEKGLTGRIPPNSTMVYEVELLDYTYRPKQAPFEPGDPEKTKALKSGLKYQVLVAGSGDSPAGNDIVEIEYTTWTLKGQVVFGTFRIGQTIKAPIQSLSHPFFHEVLPMMKRGSEWRIVVPQAQTVEQMNFDTVWHVKLIDHGKAETMPEANAAAETTTRSGLVYERLAEGKGDRPRDKFFCELEWDFWKKDGTFIAGSKLVGRMPLTIGKAQHKFLNEIVRLMQVGEVLRVEVPATMTPPRMMRFDTVWRLKLLRIKAPIPAPKFQLPPDTEMKKTRSGLKYKVLERGDGRGPTPRMGQTVVVHYSGWLTTGKLFDSSYEKNQEATFQVGQVIRGWNEGLQLMKPGDTFLFWIPAELGYGARGTPDGSIPPNANLVFQVKLLDVR